MTPKDSAMIKIILAANPALSLLAEGMAWLLESQDDFQIVARPSRAEQLFPVMDKRTASVLVVIAGFYSFPAVAQVAARSKTVMAVLTHNAAEGQIEYLRQEMKAHGAHGAVFDETATPADVIDFIRKVSKEEVA